MFEIEKRKGIELILKNLEDNTSFKIIVVVVYAQRDIIFWRNLSEYDWISIYLGDSHCKIPWNGHGSTYALIATEVCQHWTNQYSKIHAITAHFSITKLWIIFFFYQHWPFQIRNANPLNVLSTDFPNNNQQ